MTPKEKAKELVDKFFSNALPDAVECDLNVGKQCARIAVNELMELAKKYETKNCKLLMDNLKILYWQEVKQEIEKL